MLLRHDHAHGVLTHSAASDCSLLMAAGTLPLMLFPPTRRCCSEVMVKREAGREPLKRLNPRASVTRRERGERESGRGSDRRFIDTSLQEREGGKERGGAG